MKMFLKWFLLGFLLRALQALPQVGGDTNTWGTELNGFLSVSHNPSTGELLDAAVGKVNFNFQNNVASYTVANSDAGKVISMFNASACTVVIPTGAAMGGGAMPIGQTFMVREGGAGQVTIQAAAGVTLQSRGNAFRTAGQSAYVTAVQIAADTWELTGDVAV